MNHELLIITGEDSGDLYGGNLAREIKKLSPDINISGVGGRQRLCKIAEQEGLETLTP